MEDTLLNSLDNMLAELTSLRAENARLKQELRIRMGDATAMPEGWVLQQHSRPWILAERQAERALLSVDSVRHVIEGFVRNFKPTSDLRGFPERESTSPTPLLDASDDMNARYNAAYPNP